MEQPNEHSEFQPGQGKGPHKRPVGFGKEASGFNKGKEKEESFGEGGSSGRYKKLCSRGHWKPGEDAKLIELVEQLGPHNWNLIAEGLTGRTGNPTNLHHYLLVGW